MPDIVLMDGSGQSQTYSGATALGVDKVDGGIAVFVSKDLLPTAYTHPETHPASMITGLTQVATGGAFNHLLQKPFCDLPKLEETEVTFEKFGDNECYIAENITNGWDPIEGETYTITLDGEVYTCVGKNFASQPDVPFESGLYLGNTAKIYNFGWGEDTGEPFIILVMNDPGYPDEIGTMSIMTSLSGEKHSVSVIPTRAVKPLDAKYLPDEVATKEWVEETTAAGSGGTADVDILPEQTFTFNPITQIDEGTATVHVIEGDSSLLECLLKINAGESYNVVINGVEYDSVGLDAEELVGDIPENQTINGLGILGNFNIMAAGSLGGGVPFFIMGQDISETIDGETTNTKVAELIYVFEESVSDPVDLTVRIYQKGSGVSWDNKYLDIVEVEDEKDLFSKTTVTPFSPLSQYGGLYGMGYNFPESGASDNFTASFDLVVGDTCTVEWDGTEYDVVAADAGNVMEGALVLGNGSFVGLPGNGEPFAIGYVSRQGITFLSTTETVDSHEIRIYRKAYGPIIKPEVLPIWGNGSRYGEAVLPETVVEGFTHTNSAAELYESGIASGITFTERETYTVIWDGTEYSCVANIVSGIAALGEADFADMYLDGEPSYPFLIGSDGEIIIITSDTSTDTHTVAIYKGAATKTIDPKYIPDPPFFDLTAMGLPDIPMDGTRVSAECDTTGLMSALEKNTTKISFTMAQNVITGVLTAMKLNGSYQGGYIGILGSTPYLLSIIVSDGCLEGNVAPLGGSNSTDADIQAALEEEY